MELTTQTLHFSTHVKSNRHQMCDQKSIFLYSKIDQIGSELISMESQTNSVDSTNFTHKLTNSYRSNNKNLTNSDQQLVNKSIKGGVYFGY